MPSVATATLPARPPRPRSFETGRCLRALLTRQALKTLLNYLSETNGEMHM